MNVLGVGVDAKGREDCVDFRVVEGIKTNGLTNDAAAVDRTNKLELERAHF